MNEILKQASAFFAIVITLFILGQTTLPNRLPFFTEIVEIKDSNTSIFIPRIISQSIANSDIDSLMIKSQFALFHFENNSALFIDARSKDDYGAGHILGALNIPYHAFIEYLDTLDTFPKDTLIITYCDGATCNASMELTRNLQLMGFTNVKPFFGGWQFWRNAGYPYEVSD